MTFKINGEFVGLHRLRFVPIKGEGTETVLPITRQRHSFFSNALQHQHQSSILHVLTKSVFFGTKIVIILFHNVSQVLFRCVRICSDHDHRFQSLITCFAKASFCGTSQLSWYFLFVVWPRQPCLVVWSFSSGLSSP